MRMFANTGNEKLKTASGMYGNPIDIRIIRKNQFCVLKLPKLGGGGGGGWLVGLQGQQSSVWVWSWDIAWSLFFTETFLPKLDFPLEHQIKLVLKCLRKNYFPLTSLATLRYVRPKGNTNIRQLKMCLAKISCSHMHQLTAGSFTCMRLPNPKRKWFIKDHYLLLTIMFYDCFH